MWLCRDSSSSPSPCWTSGGASSPRPLVAAQTLWSQGGRPGRQTPPWGPWQDSAGPFEKMRTEMETSGSALTQPCLRLCQAGRMRGISHTAHVSHLRISRLPVCCYNQFSPSPIPSATRTDFSGACPVLPCAVSLRSEHPHAVPPQSPPGAPLRHLSAPSRKPGCPPGAGCPVGTIFLGVRLCKQTFLHSIDQISDVCINRPKLFLFPHV